jgi:acyl carrier protein
MNEVEVAERRILEFLKSEIVVDGADAELTVESPLLNGAVDSLGLMQLVSFLEEEFEIEVDDADISQQHFSTVSDISRLVSGKVVQG